MQDHINTPMKEYQQKYADGMLYASGAIVYYLGTEGQASHKEIMQFYNMPRSTFYYGLAKLKATYDGKYAFERGSISVAVPITRGVLRPGVTPRNIMFPQPDELDEEMWNPKQRKWTKTFRY